MKTTAAQEKGNTATLDPPAAEAEVEFGRIPVGAVQPSTHNPRKITDDHPSIVELAASIKAEGLIQPIVVRPIGDDIYEIVAGERRWRAFRKAHGVKASILCIVRELSDRSAREITVTENLHREDLSPLEEAAGVADLMDLYDGDLKAVASQLGKEMKWVARRSRLATLSTNWRNFIGDPSNEDLLSQWSVGHYEIVARLAPDAQDELLTDVIDMSWIFDGIAIDGLERRIADKLRDLSKAPWDLSDQVLDPDAGSCVDCMKRSDCHPGLFDDPPSVKPSDKCLDAVCWDQKFRAFVRQREDEERRKHPDLVLVSTNYGNIPALADIPYLCPNEFLSAKKSDAGAVPALVVDGKGRGDVKWIVPNATTSTQSGTRPRRDPVTGKPKSGPMSMKEKLAGLEKRRQVKAVEFIRKEVESYGKTPKREDIVLLAAIFGTSRRLDRPYGYCSDEGPPFTKTLLHKYGQEDSKGPEGRPWKDFQSIRGTDQQYVDEQLWKTVEHVLLQRLNYRAGETRVDQMFAEACLVASLVGVDHEKLKEKADAEIATPKSWQVEDAKPVDQKTVSADPKAGKTPAKKKAVTKKRQPAGKGAGR